VQEPEQLTQNADLVHVQRLHRLQIGLVLLLLIQIQDRLDFVLVHDLQQVEELLILFNRLQVDLVDWVDVVIVDVVGTILVNVVDDENAFEPQDLAHMVEFVAGPLRSIFKAWGHAVNL